MTFAPKYCLVKRENEIAAVLGPGDYARSVSPDEVIEGKRVAEYRPGCHVLKAFPPEPQ